MVPHYWCQWEEWCPIIGVSGRSGAPSLVSVGGMVSHHWYCGRNSVPSLVSVGGIVPHHWCQWEE
ncbi:unnamed protein product [Staurois parvus]|uniref:Uncharacterized protein n=1 Tax=Staurois parvus TaxID=386267 RepID=A0ABN9GIR5_9NEOB|nr:unnamed protein product [Staurois parvus]